MPRKTKASVDPRPTSTSTPIKQKGTRASPRKRGRSLTPSQEHIGSLTASQNTNEVRRPVPKRTKRVGQPAPPPNTARPPTPQPQKHKPSMGRRPTSPSNPTNIANRDHTPKQIITQSVPSPNQNRQTMDQHEVSQEDNQLLDGDIANIDDLATRVANVSMEETEATINTEGLAQTIPPPAATQSLSPVTIPPTQQVTMVPTPQGMVPARQLNPAGVLVPQTYMGPPQIVTPQGVLPTIPGINYSQLLNTTLPTTRDRLRELEQSIIVTRPSSNPKLNETLELTKQLHQSLFVLAKASHHRLVMEEAFTEEQPPKGLNISLKVSPNIYKGNDEVQKQFKEITEKASMKLVGVLYTHYSKVAKLEIENQKGLNLKFLALLEACTTTEEKGTLQTKWDEAVTKSNKEVKDFMDKVKAKRDRKSQNPRKRPRASDDEMDTDSPGPSHPKARKTKGMPPTPETNEALQALKALLPSLQPLLNPKNGKGGLKGPHQKNQKGKKP